MKIKINDKVVVISGKYKKHEGKVINVNKVKSLVFIENTNLVKKSLKNKKNDENYIFVAKGIHVSNVKKI